MLGTFVPQGEPTGTILMSAQDAFFAEPHDDLAAAAADFRRAVSGIEGMTIDREPSQATIANRPARRVDFSGVGLYRAMVMADIRCHLVSVNVTARSPEDRESLARGLGRLAAAAGRAAAATPACVRDYARGDSVLHRVEPLSAGPSATPIPVRLIIGAGGAVQHVHVIHATAAQRRSIEEALRQWRFRPHVVEGRAVAVETGLAVQMP